MHNQSVSEYLMYVTVRIECTFQDGSLSTGTGFIMGFKDDPIKKTHVPFIVTNKHVVEGDLESILFFLSQADQNGIPIDGDKICVNITNPSNGIINHPEADVDLCAIDMAPIFRNLKERGINIPKNYVSMNWIPSKEVIESLTAMEDIVMVGYPNGIWDDVNNKPIFRKGVTASHLKFDFKGEKEFPTDIASFPGSSGSPVFILNQGTYFTKDGFMNSGNRLIFIGIHCAGFNYNSHGQVYITNPKDSIASSTSKVAINLGVAIKSERILELNNEIILKAEGADEYRFD